jgi:LysM repeat protein
MYHRLPRRSKRRPSGLAVAAPLLVLILVAALACPKLLDEGAGDGDAESATPTGADWPPSGSDPSAWSPVATAAPEVSPTPVVHIVQPDETLVSISLDYEVDLELLQLVNGIDDPSLLQIGQQLVIPRGDELIATPSPLLLPTPTPLPASVRGAACYETPVGSLQCLGEIVNTSALTITNAHVNVALVDPSGISLLEADAQAAADVLPPGGRSPFRLLFTKPPEAWSGLSVEVARAEVAGLIPLEHVPIAVVVTGEERAGEQYQISGTVENVSQGLVAEGVSIIVTAYDVDGYVIAVRQVDVDVGEALLPGEEAEFVLLLAYHDGPPAQTNVVAQGRTAVGH